MKLSSETKGGIFLKSRFSMLDCLRNSGDFGVKSLDRTAFKRFMMNQQSSIANDIKKMYRITKNNEEFGLEEFTKWYVLVRDNCGTNSSEFYW